MAEFRIKDAALVPDEFRQYCPNCSGAGSPQPDECCVTCCDLGTIPDHEKIAAALDKDCENCKGSGTTSTGYPDFEAQECDTCNGTGKRVIPGVERL